MKKLLVLALIATLGIATTGCGMSFSYANPVTGKSLSHDDDDDDWDDDDDDIEDEIERRFNEIEDEKDLEELFAKAEKKLSERNNDDDDEQDIEEEYVQDEVTIETLPVEGFYDTARGKGLEANFKSIHIEDGILYIDGSLMDMNGDVTENKLHMLQTSDDFYMSGMLPAGYEFLEEDYDNINYFLGEDGPLYETSVAMYVENGVVINLSMQCWER